MGTDDGVVHRIARFGSVSSPSTFARRDTLGDAPVTTLHFSPLMPDLLLVGYGDGAVAYVQRPTGHADVATQ